MRVRNSCILLCAALLAAACSTTRRLGTDEVLYTGVRKIRIEPDSGVVLSAAAESAVKEPLSVYCLPCLCIYRKVLTRKE